MKPININNKLWIKNFSLLKEYLKKHGNVYPKKHSKDQDENKLAVWVYFQRRYYRENILPDQYITQLEELPDFNFDAVKQSWLSNFYKLSRFMAKNEKLPSILSYTIEEIELFIWVRTQKFLFSQGRLEQYKVELFKNLYGWVWSVLGENWRQRYQELKRFLSNNDGKYPSKHSKDPDEKTLRLWVATQRSFYNKGKLQDKRIKKLNAIKGWIFNPLKGKWKKNYLKLKEFLSKNNREYPKVVSAKDQNENSLGRWIAKQRGYYKKGELPEHKIRELKQLEGWVWDPCKYRWEKQYSEIKEFLSNNNGKCPKAYSKDQNEKRIGLWASNHRKDYKKGKLPANIVDKLNAIDGWRWDLRERRKGV